MKKLLSAKLLSLAILSSFAMTGFAEDAPVYDVDSYPPQFDGQNDQAQQAPPPAYQQAETESTPSYESPSVSQNQAPTTVSAPAYVPPPANLSIDQRVGRLENQLGNALNSDSFTKFSEMQSQIQVLRGQVEQLTHQLQLLQTQQKAMYSDLEKRVNHSPTISEDNYEESGNKAKPAVKPVEVKQPNTAEEQHIYQQAYALIKAKKYNEAAATFEDMLKKYPTGQFAANAHYWLGELYGLMGNNDKALTEFSSVVRDYPTSSKLADAQLKLGLIYVSQQKWSDAKSSFKKVITHFPGTSFARLATEQLKQIKSSGH